MSLKGVRVDMLFLRADFRILALDDILFPYLPAPQENREALISNETK